MHRAAVLDPALTRRRGQLQPLNALSTQPRSTNEIKLEHEDLKLFNSDGDSAEEFLNEMAGYIMFPLKSALLSSIRSAVVAERCLECIEIISRCVEPDTVVREDLYVTLVEVLVEQKANASLSNLNNISGSLVATLLGIVEAHTSATAQVAYTAVNVLDMLQENMQVLLTTTMPKAVRCAAVDVKTKLERTCWRGSVEPKASQSVSSAMTKITSGSLDANVVKVYRSNVLNVTLALEALARVAQAMGPAFQNTLIDLPYPLLENAGHPTRIISDSAFAALSTIAGVYGYSYADLALTPSIGVSSLIVGYVDYVVNMACRRIRHVSMNPRGLPFSALWSVFLVSEVLDALDRYHSLYPSLVAVLFGVLFEVIDTIEVHKSGDGDGREVAVRRKRPPLEPTRVDRLLDLIPREDENVQPSPVLIKWSEEFLARKEQREEREKARQEQTDIGEIREFFKYEDRSKAGHAAWPLILSRLTDIEHYIVLEAVETITCFEISREIVCRRDSAGSDPTGGWRA
ncbi:hypothetical protein BJ742DRAFT_776575 [Cladochytrium replicatum]|nr:hypothetical protein BJ742DRAFT_776575 [Cladochytrium replicatum]